MNTTPSHKFLTACIVVSLSLSACSTGPKTVSVVPVQTVMSESINSETATLTVTVSDIETPAGNVSAALFNESGYKSGGQIQGQRVDVTGDTVILVFKDVPMGEYGIKLFHDVDNSGEMNTNPFGIPTEPYAFSNSVKGTMGPAKWEKAKFTVSPGETTHAISMK